MNLFATICDERKRRAERRARLRVCATICRACFRSAEKRYSDAEPVSIFRFRPLRLEGRSSQAHRLPRSRRCSCSVPDQSKSTGQESLREWTRPPDRAAVGRATFPLTKPLPKTSQASHCLCSPACDDGLVAVHAIQRGSAPILVLNVPAPEETHQPYTVTIAHPQGIDQAHVKGLVPNLDALSCLS